MLGSYGGLKLECTNVSSTSNTRVFLPLLLGLYGGNKMSSYPFLDLGDGGFTPVLTAGIYVF